MPDRWLMQARRSPPREVVVFTGGTVATSVSSASDLAAALAGLRAGEKVRISVVGTDGGTRTRTVTLEQPPGS